MGGLEVEEGIPLLLLFLVSPTQQTRVRLPPLPLLPRGQLRESHTCIFPGEGAPLAEEGSPLGVLTA